MATMSIWFNEEIFIWFREQLFPEPTSWNINQPRIAFKPMDPKIDGDFWYHYFDKKYRAKETNLNPYLSLAEFNFKCERDFLEKYKYDRRVQRVDEELFSIDMAEAVAFWFTENMRPIPAFFDDYEWNIRSVEYKNRAERIYKNYFDRIKDEYKSGRPISYDRLKPVNNDKITKTSNAGEKLPAKGFKEGIHAPPFRRPLINYNTSSPQMRIPSKENTVLQENLIKAPNGEYFDRSKSDRENLSRAVKLAREDTEDNARAWQSFIQELVPNQHTLSARLYDLRMAEYRDNENRMREGAMCWYKNRKYQKKPGPKGKPD
jgi:hypothetical protein